MAAKISVRTANEENIFLIHLYKLPLLGGVMKITTVITRGVADDEIPSVALRSACSIITRLDMKVSEVPVYPDECQRSCGDVQPIT